MSDVPEQPENMGRRVGDVPDRPPTIHHDADSVVEQAVERAAVKVAAAATPTVNGTEVLNKMGSIVAVAIIVIVGLANFFVNIQTRQDIKAHQEDFKTLCEVFVSFAPPEKTTDLAKALAECLR